MNSSFSKSGFRSCAGQDLNPRHPGRCKGAVQPAAVKVLIRYRFQRRKRHASGISEEMTLETEDR
jgi:hypothetical protein